MLLEGVHSAVATDIVWAMEALGRGRVHGNEQKAMRMLPNGDGAYLYIFISVTEATTGCLCVAELQQNFL